MVLNNKKGFTLIELLVVIAIIGILSTLAVLALGNARTKARDSKRVTDLRQIGNALDLYYNDQNYYPTEIIPGQPLKSPDGTKTYIGKIPSNPTPRTDGGCADNDYSYASGNNNKTFTLNSCLGNPVSNLSPGIITYTQSGFTGSGGGGPTPWACGDTISYGGETYPTVEIGSQCWLAKNLNIGTRINSCSGGFLGGPCSWNSEDPSNQADADAGTIEKYCYEDSGSNCDTGGGLYQWHTAMAFKQICDNHNNTSPCVPSATHQGICPAGWHIPTFNEFQTLAQFVDDDHGCELDCAEGACDCYSAGSKLKSSTWDGTDNYLFSIIPTGKRDSLGGFGSYEAYIWLANPYSAIFRSWHVYVPENGGDFGVAGFEYYRADGYSIRCIKD